VIDAEFDVTEELPFEATPEIEKVVVSVTAGALPEIAFPDEAVNPIDGKSGVWVTVQFALTMVVSRSPANGEPVRKFAAGNEIVAFGAAGAPNINPLARK
jgi:hypothetical protein